MGCPVWQRGAGAASISVPPTGILPRISPLQSSRLPPLLPALFKQPLSSQPYTASFVLFLLPCHHPPTLSLSLKRFFLLWFSCQRLPSIPCLAQHPLLPGPWAPSLPEHMQSRGISFYCPHRPCGPPISRSFAAITHLEWKRSC